MEATPETKLGMMGALIRRLREENARLREENARLQGKITQEQRIFDAQDEEVFRMARGQAGESQCERTVVVIAR